MKAKIVCILLVTLLIATALPAVGTIYKLKTKERTISSGPQIEWIKNYGGYQFDQFRCVKQTSDGDYIAWGEYEEENINHGRLILVDATGNEIWSTVNYDINGSNYDEELMHYVIETNDGGFIASGSDIYYYPIETGFWNPGGFLWKVDSDGETVWHKYFYDEEEILWGSLFEFALVEDGYIGGGMAIDYLDENLTEWTMDILLMKVDFDGNIVWYENYDLGGYELATSFDILADDEGYFLSGFYSVNEVIFDDDDDFCMMKTDLNGVKQWHQIFGGEIMDGSPTRGCGQTSDGGYTMCGLTESFSAIDGGKWDIWQIKTNSMGTMQWENLFGGPGYENCWGMCITSDGRCILPIAYNLGTTDPGTKEDLLLVETNDMGHVLVKYLFEVDDKQIPMFIDETNDGGFIIGGRTDSPDDKDTDAILIKISPFENQRPDAPSRPTGKTEGAPGEEITFSTSGSDPDGDDVLFRWDWDDGNLSDWKRTTEVSYSWEKQGNYSIKIMSKDDWGGESDWSDSLTVNIPRHRFRNTPLLDLFQRYLDLFPLFKILFQHLGL
jgi:hypothetical protein